MAASLLEPRGDAPVNPDALLVRAIGLRQLTATIFNYTVGSGIFALPAVVVAQLGGAAPLAYLLCALLMALVVLTFAEAGSRVSASGGPYAYVEAGLGPFAGFVAGVLNLLADVSAAGAVSMLLAGTFARLLGAAGPVSERLIVIVVVAGLAALNVRGVRHGTRLIEVATAAKLVPLLLFVVVGAFFVQPANLAWGTVPGARDVTRTAAVLIFAFTGIEAALQPSGEVRDAHRTVPRATMLALGAVTLLYLAVQLVALGVLGPALASDQVTPLATAAGRAAGAAGRALLLAGATISMFGWLSGSLMATPRGLFAFARDGFLPRRLAAVHPAFRTPHLAIATNAVLVLALALTGSFARLAVLSALATLGVYLLVALCVPALRRRGIRAEGAPFVLPGGATIPALAVLVILWITSQSVGARELVAFGVTLVAALVLWAVRARMSAVRPAP